MRVDKWLSGATTKLEKISLSTAHLDALVLLEDTSRKDRSWLLAHPEQELDEKQVSHLNKQIARRAEHEPLAYIRGKTEFFGRDFFINCDVLEPRPETETMIEAFLKLELPEHAHVVDLGTGSGAIGITIKLERPDYIVDMIDIDERCLQVADKNIRKHKADVKLLRLDLLHHALGPYDVILANLPYVPDDFTINEAALREPKLAIFGGPDGLDLYRRMLKQLASFKWKPRFILTESLPPQHENLALIAKKAGFKQVDEVDFIQVFKA